MSPKNKNMIAVFLVSLSIFSTSFGMVVYDPLTEAYTFTTKVKEVEMAQEKIQQMKYMAKDSGKFSDLQWDEARAALNDLANAMKQNNALAYSMSDVDQKFKESYPGYTQNATTDYSKKYKNWVQTNQDTMHSLLDQVVKSYQQENQEAASIQTLSERAKGSQGRMQALQVANEIASEQIAQLQKLKATMMAQANAQAEYYAYQSQKDAARQQTVDAMVKKAKDSEPFPDYKDNKTFGLIPEFKGGN